jgi:hypothetical protein
MVNTISYTIYAARQTIAFSTFTQSPACGITPTNAITYSSTFSGSYTYANSLAWLTSNLTSFAIYSNDLLLAGSTVYLK